MALEIVGYTDRLSVRPGDTLRFMVSSSQGEPYDVDFVRLRHGDVDKAGPGFRASAVRAPITGRRFPGRPQEIHAGSYVRVDDGGALDLDAFAVQAAVYPTHPTAGAQVLISRWDASQSAGWALALDADGIALWLGDGTGRVERFSTGVALLEHCWYFAQASIDGGGHVTVRQVPLISNPSSRASVTVDRAHLHVAVSATATARSRGGADTPTLLGAAFDRWERARVVPAHLLNGKLDRPRITREPLEPADLLAKSTNGTIAAWEFHTDLDRGGAATTQVADAGPHRLDGVTVNRPMRAATGHNWTSDEQSFVHAPEQYGAIHFHDDDLDDAAWDVDFELEIPSDWRSGVYAAHLRTITGADDYVPFFVRPAEGAEARLAFLVPTASYLAYANDHNPTNAAMTEVGVSHAPVMTPHDLFLAAHREYGLSTYDTHTDGSGVCYSSRLRPLLNMRPRLRSWLSASVWQFNADLHLVDWLEELGFAYDVLTDEDLDRERDAALDPYTVVMTGSHPEYVSAPMLDALERFQLRGGRFMYMGGNGFYWVTGFDPQDGHTIEVRKGFAAAGWKAAPGEYHLSFTSEFGTLWRNRGRTPQKLVGTGFVAQGLDESSYFRRQRGSYAPEVAWIFEGIDEEILGDFGLVGGGAAGLELDIMDATLGTPESAFLLAASEDHTDGYLIALEDLFYNTPVASGTSSPRVRADLVYFTTSRGGAVFSASSIAFCGSLSHNGYDNTISRLVRNVLTRFLDDEPLPAH